MSNAICKPVKEFIGHYVRRYRKDQCVVSKNAINDLVKYYLCSIVEKTLSPHCDDECYFEVHVNLGSCAEILIQFCETIDPTVSALQVGDALREIIDVNDFYDISVSVTKVASFHLIKGAAS